MDKREKRLWALQRQAQRLENRLNAMCRRSDQLSRWRLLSFVAALVISGVTLWIWGPLVWVAATPFLLVPFILTVYWHRQVDTAVSRHTLWRQIKTTQIGRMQLDWDSLPPEAPLTPPPQHPFALDLDLLGQRSIHRLLDIAVTREGSQRLAAWLLATQPDPDQTRRRQNSVQELETLPRLRDRLQLRARLVMAEPANASARPAADSSAYLRWPGQRLLDWLHQPDDGQSLRPVLIFLTALSLLNLILLGLNLVGLLPPVWLGTWFFYAAVALSQSRKVEPVFRDAAFLADSIRTLNAVFDLLETTPLTNQPCLQKLCAPFLQADKRPSQHLKRVNWIVAAAGLRFNPMVALLLNALIPWDIFFAYRLSQFKQGLGSLLPTWLDVWFELEALNSLANFRYLNPQTTYPILETDVLHAPPLRLQAVGHPLIPTAERVCNTFTADTLGQVTIITGSNMAGKSSFLRAVGVNICLGLAGGPVLARELRMIPLRLAASITVTDSVTDGFSFFYAEVRRLKDILERLQLETEWPLLFLIDEIFRGTNNRERLIGSQAYVRAMVGGKGIGIIATHDLELVRLEDESPWIRNFHFRDAVENGRMVFDYKLHPGPCPTTNALKIMQLAGLPVTTRS